MKTKSSAHYQREYRRRLREQGLVKKEVWIRPNNAKQLAACEKLLRGEVDKLMSAHTLLEKGEQHMSELKPWDTASLFEALEAEELFTSAKASVELIGGLESSLHIVMHEYGDLPLFLTVAGDQLIVEAVLWSTEEVRQLAEFNDAVLRTHKYFPLSTISLDTLGDGKDYYQMFGALSAMSILPNVVFEIEMLAANVIQATEAYGDLLNTAIEA